MQLLLALSAQTGRQRIHNSLTALIMQAIRYRAIPKPAAEKNTHADDGAQAERAEELHEHGGGVIEELWQKNG